MENAELRWSDFYTHTDRKTGVIDNRIEVQYWFYANNAVVNGSRYYMKFIKVV